MRLGGLTRQVVGLVEDPAQLDDAFGLVTATPAGAQVSYTLLVKASAGEVAAFRARATVPGGITVETPTYYSRDLGVLLVAALGMMLVAVVSLHRVPGAGATAGPPTRDARRNRSNPPAGPQRHGDPRADRGRNRGRTGHRGRRNRLGADQPGDRASLRASGELEFGAVVADPDARGDGCAHLRACGVVAGPHDGPGSGRSGAVEPADGRTASRTVRGGRGRRAHRRRALPAVRSPAQRATDDHRSGRDDRLRAAHHPAGDTRPDRAHRQFAVVWPYRLARTRPQPVTLGRGAGHRHHRRRHQRRRGGHHRREHAPARAPATCPTGSSSSPPPTPETRPWSRPAPRARPTPWTTRPPVSPRHCPDAALHPAQPGRRPQRTTERPSAGNR